MSVCVCLSVRVQNFGAAWRLQKWSDLAEILHTCSLGEYLVVYFVIFRKFRFLGSGNEFLSQNLPKMTVNLCGISQLISENFAYLLLFNLGNLFCFVFKFYNWAFKWFESYWSWAQCGAHIWLFDIGDGIRELLKSF